MSQELDFEQCFETITGHKSFDWQRRLYQRLSSGDVPSVCDIPTGLGKTAVIPIWLIALANDASKLPRRLVYVVNRRTVVDQATREAEKLRNSLEKAGLVEPLNRLCALVHDKPLAISTLRGQFADNREWRADPSRPAIIVGTVDMIGSRLLFSGYGCAFRSRPLHAGFLGQDVLLVHDEAHLEPAFQELLIAIEKEQRQGERSEQLPWTKLRVMELSATSRKNETEEDEEEPFALTCKEKNPPEVIPDPPTEPIHHVWRRLKAKKTIHLTENKDQNKLADEIVDLALEKKFKDSNRAVLVFVRKVDDVETIVTKLKKDKQEVQQLTGTLRGLERDRMADPRKETACPIFARFLKPPKPDADEEECWKIEPKPGTVYLVCTSAGEVGIDISADHLVCDLSTFESMAQRLGRVNRFGDRDDTEIHVVYPSEFDEKKDHELRLKKTLDLLRELKGDGSPLALSKLDPSARSAAFSPTPKILPATDILFDAWTLTTIRDKLPGRPPVEPYLHGISEWKPPDTHVAWRAEVGVITSELREEYKPRDLLDDFPLKPHELLRDHSYRVFKHLEALVADPKPTAKMTAEERQKAKERAELNRQSPVWIIEKDEPVIVTTLDEIASGKKERLNGVTILLPPDVGGLENGLLNGSSKTANDVADEWFSDKDKTIRRRVRVWDDDPEFDEKTNDMRLVRRRIDTRPDVDELEEEEGETTTRRFWYWYEHPKAGDNDGSKWSSKPVLWQVHTDDVAKNATRIAEKLLKGDMKQAVILAAKFHDLGKHRESWQRSIGNPNPTDWHAKSGKDPTTSKWWKSRNICPNYRHEFGSLLDVSHGDNGSPPAEFAELSEEMKDLVLHLIATHHGRARPHFPLQEAFDPKRPTSEWYKAAAEVPRRFARLQRKYGRWGLAYLESLLRAADWAASANPSPTTADQPASKPKQSTAPNDQPANEEAQP